MVALLAARPGVTETVPPQIALLRLAMLECRTASRRDLELCGRVDPSAPPEVHATALAQMLFSASDRRFVCWRPGTTDMSFDERWLAALIAARARGDTDSARFLLARRFRPEACPAFWALVEGLTSRLIIF